MDHNSENNTVSPLRAGLFCKCPKCGKGNLYNGYLTFADKCAVCGQDFHIFDSADGPAVFIVLFLGFIIVALALIVEVSFKPPLWLHMLLWIPSIIGGSLLLLRPAKALMVAMQYRFNAQEGKLDQ